MSIPAEQFTQRLMLLQQLKKYMLAYEDYLRHTPPRFDGRVDPWVRLGTGRLRADDLSELGKSVDHFRLALEATAQLDNAHYDGYHWGPEPKKEPSR